MNKIRENKLLEEFYNSDIKNPIALLEWFYKSIPLRSIFDSDDVCQNIYNKLVECGYSPVLSPQERYYTSQTLTSKEKVEQDAISAAKLPISEIMMELKFNIPLKHSTMDLIKSYNEKYNFQKTYEVMMSALCNKIGENVSVISCHKGKAKSTIGILNQVDQYNSIMVAGEKIPFIGSGVAISTIYDDEGNVLYHTNIPLGYDLEDFEEINQLKQEYFGEKTMEIKQKVY